MSYKFPDDESDARSLTLTADEFQASLFMDSIIDQAKRIPENIYKNPDNWKNPIVRLAYTINSKGTVLNGK